jgi:IS30 family transposase
VNETTEELVKAAQGHTEEMRLLLTEVALRGNTRREIWAELNRRGLSQKKIAVACGVVSQTVYTELRRRRERLDEEGAAK